MSNLKAPKGGLVSSVNGRFYNGGEFVPDSGLYCGKGRNKVKAEDFERVKAKAEAEGLILTYDERFERFYLLVPPMGLSQQSAPKLKAIETALDMRSRHREERAKRDRQALQVPLY